MKKIFTTLLSCGMISVAFAQWTPSAMRGEQLRSTKVANYYNLDLDAIRSQLSEAKETGKNSKPVIISLPTLDGKIETFSVYSLPVVEKSMADKYQLGSYVGIKTDDPTVYVRFSVSPYDLQAMMFRNGSYEFIEPVNKERTVYGVMPKTNKATGADAFECRSTEPFLNKKEIENLKQSTDFTHNPTDFGKASDKKYRTYRLAISVTGEYTQYFGGVPQAASAINATMTRVNGIFEKDFAIHLNVQDFPQLIYTNPSTDPYSNASSGAQGAWSLELQRTLTSVIGNTAYDIGHLFGRSGGGGSAGDVGNVCRNPANNNDDTSKGSAYTSPGGNGTPEGDSFDVDYVAHEMGHQFGAHHTFSHGLHAGVDAHMEPGSGSTIMGYAGITSYNVQMHSDAYFLVKSIEQAQAYVNTQSCGTQTPISNNPPTIVPMPDRTIPKGTAFVLTAAATDPENDPITYTWEQYDTATSAVTTVTGNNTTGAKFRSLTGSALPYRYFPKLSNVLNGVLSSATDWEAVSNVARTMNFRVTVRDNNSDFTQQQTQIGSQKITVTNDGPFKVNTSKVYNNLTSSLIVWDVANTNNAPYNVASVKIDYSTNNGNSWTLLSNATPNDGSESFDFSALPANSQIILRVSANDNVFYAVNKATVSLADNCSSNAPTGLIANSITQTTAVIEWNAVSNATYNLKYKKASDNDWIEVNNLDVNTYTISGLTLDTQYNISVVNVCSGTASASANITITTKGIEYCVAGSNNATLERISNVNFANINRNTTSTSGYEDLTATVGDVTAGQSYTFSASHSGNTYSTDQVIVWIDFNRDGDFDDAGEQVLVSAKKVSPWTGTITIPSTATAGKTRMRVRLHDSSANYSPNSTPCGNSGYGQVEDYSLNIGQLAVTDVKKNNISVYPNPATDIINISNISSKTKFEIYSVGGQLINQGTTDGKVNVSKLTKGVYILSLESNGEKSQTKFIKN